MIRYVIYVIENDLPKTQAELVTVMERWFETNEKKIAPESDLQKFASLILQEIDAQTPDLKPAHRPSARQSGQAEEGQRKSDQWSLKGQSAGAKNDRTPLFGLPQTPSGMPPRRCRGVIPWASRRTGAAGQ
jgi:hypothetical protein